MSDGEFSVRVWSDEPLERAYKMLACLRDAKERKKLLLDPYLSHKQWNQLTRTCVACGKTEREVHMFRSVCNGVQE